MPSIIGATSRLRLAALLALLTAPYASDAAAQEVARADAGARSVLPLGDWAVIAAPNASTYVFARTRGAWSPRQQLVAADGAVDDAFGRSVALSGTTACIGAPQKNGDTGTVYVFTPPSFFP